MITIETNSLIAVRQVKGICEKDKRINRRNYRNAIIAIVGFLIILMAVTQTPMIAPMLIPGMETMSYFDVPGSQTVAPPQLLYYYFVDHDSVLLSVELALAHGTLAGLIEELGIYMPATSIAGILAQGVQAGLDATGISDILIGALIDVLPWWAWSFVPAITVGVTAFVSF